MKIHGTAKGGALSKKDFGVAFGGGSVEPETSEFTTAQWSSPSALFPMYNESPAGTASIFGNLYTGTVFAGKVIQSVSFKLKKVGTPTGNLRAQLFDDSSPPVLQGTFGDISMPTLSTSEFTEITFDTNSLTFTDGWRIVLGTDNEGSSGTGGDSSNYVGCGSDNSASISGQGMTFGFGISDVPYTCETNCSSGCVTPTSRGFCNQFADQAQQKLVYED